MSFINLCNNVLHILPFRSITSIHFHRSIFFSFHPLLVFFSSVSVVLFLYYSTLQIPKLYHTYFIFSNQHLNQQLSNQHLNALEFVETTVFSSSRVFLATKSTLSKCSLLTVNELLFVKMPIKPHHCLHSDCFVSTIVE